MRNPRPDAPRAVSVSLDSPRPTRARWLLPLCVLLGVLHTIAFAPRDWWWLQMLSLAGLYGALSLCRGVRGAALAGGTFGLGWFLSGIWWLYISMHTYGGMPAAMAGAAVVLFAIYLSFYPALAAALTQRLAPAPGVGRALVFAAAWLLGEWLRGVIFTGFPWLASGYAHTDGPLAGYAASLGVYGISGVAAACAALGVEAARRLRQTRWRPAAAPLAALLVLLGGGLALRTIHWTQPDGAPMTVRLLQGNIPQSMKFEPDTVRRAMAWYRDQIIARPADLIVTPETAFPLPLQQIPEDIARPLRGFVEATGSHVVLGAVGISTEGDTIQYANSLFGVLPHQPTLYRYDKHHLVPFGEFVPWGFHWFVNLMHMPLGDFTRGAPAQPALPVGMHRAALDICYEDLFGEEIARTLREQPEPADVLVNVSNLAWFGDTIALDQHLQIARMRTLETGRPLLAATNTGATAMIDAQGRVRGVLPYDTADVLEGTVQPYQGLTPYIRHGNLPVLLVAAVVLGAAAGVAQRKKTR